MLTCVSRQLGTTLHQFLRPRVTRCLATALGLALLAAMPVRGQSTEDSKGTDFWLMFNQNLGLPTLTLFVTGDTNTSGTVSVPGLGFTTPFSVTANTVTTIAIPSGASVTSNDVVSNLGIHVTSADEVTVYGLNRITATTDAFLGLPTDILGTEYIVLTHENVNIVNAVLFGVVGTVNGTTVTITPSVTTGARAAGVPYDIVLNQGQTYQLVNTSANPADLTGTIITSTSPVAVFSGHQCANVPNGSTVACDHLIEQTPPASTWGQSFVTMPLATRTGGDTFRFLAQAANTNISVNGVNVATLGRGQVHERLITGPARINADKPILVAQFSNGSSFDGVTSDPFMMLIPPFEQFLAGYTVTTPATGFGTNFVNVVAPSTAVGSITRNGVVIPAASFVAIPGSTFRGAQVAVPLGSHTFAGPQPFGVFVYGFDSFDSYGYPGGLALGKVASVTTLDLTPATATNPVNTSHCVTATVRDQDADPLSGVRVDFSVTGPNARNGFAFTDGAGAASFCYVGTAAGTDTITAAVGSLSDTSTKVWTASTALVCDIDGDIDIDSSDLQAIRLANGKTVPPASPALDVNKDGRVNVADVRACTLKCTRPGCAP